MSGELGTPKGSFDPKTRGPVTNGDSVTQQADNTIDLRNGQRRWEGDHRVVIIGKAPTWDTEILIDGAPLQRDTERVEIDIDCKQPIAIVKLTRYARALDGQLIVEGDELKRHTEELSANLLNITLEEARVVDVILNKARQEASSNGMAVQLFAISETDEHGEQTTQVLGKVLRDAARYRALAAAIGDERIRVDEYPGRAGGRSIVSRVVGSLGLEALSEQLVAEQAAELRAQKERAQ